MLGYCIPLEVVKQQGIAFKEFTCLARSSGLDVQMFRLTGQVTQQYFRELVRSVTTSDDRVIVMNYSREVLKQNGGGHFSPVGGYHPRRDLILVMDVARYKYPPHWVPLSTLWEAMAASTATGKVYSSFTSVHLLNKSMHYNAIKKIWLGHIRSSYSACFFHAMHS